MIHVLLVDDHPALRMGLKILLDRAPDIQVIAEASSGPEALTRLVHYQPTVMVLDCQLPEMDGIEVARAVQAQGLPTRILALSAYDDPGYVRGMVKAGAVGYLLKNEAPDAIVAAVRAAEKESWFSPSIAKTLLTILREGESLPPPITEREHEVLEGLVQGWTNQQIGHALHISERTVGYHVVNLLNKLGVDNRTAAVVEAIRQGWVEV